MSTCSWIGFAEQISSLVNRIHILPCTAAISTPYPVNVIMNIIAYGKRVPVKVDGLRLMKPDGFVLESILDDIWDKWGSMDRSRILLGIEIKMSCPQYRGKLMDSRVLIEMRYECAQTYLFPKCKDERSTGSYEHFEGNDDTVKTLGDENCDINATLLLQDCILQPSVIVINRGLKPANPKVIVSCRNNRGDGEEYEEICYPLGEIGACSIREVSLDGISGSSLVEIEGTPVIRATTIYPIAHSEQELYYFLVYRHCGNRHIASVRGL